MPAAQAARRASGGTSANGTNANANPTTFEFTRRKKWQDILLSELPDTVLFVLDVHRVIQYANPGATEALGWDVEEMVDKDVLDFVNSAFLIITLLFPQNICSDLLCGMFYALDARCFFFSFKIS